MGSHVESIEMRSLPGPEGNDRVEKATHVAMFVGALVLHGLASAVLLWTFAGPVDSWLAKAIVGLVVGAPWLLWLVQMPWAARDLVRALSRRTPAPDVDVIGSGADAAGSLDGVSDDIEPAKLTA